MIGKQNVDLDRYTQQERKQHCLNNPSMGPAILFFSGGSALDSLCQSLKHYTYNSIHLITPFDSGGSSAKLRQAFDMPSIGDLRNRIMALADDGQANYAAIYRLFQFRFAKDASGQQLHRLLEQIANVKSDLVTTIPTPLRELVCDLVKCFIALMPADFDLRGASIGNLILTTAYLRNEKQLRPVIELFSKLINVHGIVRPIVNKDLHIGADLKDGSRIIGQHLLTGKEVAPITSPIEKLFLSKSADHCEPIHPHLQDENRLLIEEADMICYPPGSYYSSLMANLLPVGVGQAISNNKHNKVYIPNLGSDPEQIGMDLEQMVLGLLQHLKADVQNNCPTESLINYIILDSKNGQYPQTPSASFLSNLNIEVIDAPLISQASAPYYDNDLLLDALLSLT